MFMYSGRRVHGVIMLILGEGFSCYSAILLNTKKDSIFKNRLNGNVLVFFNP